MDLLIDTNNKSTEIDAHRIMKRLWQGSYPASGAVLRDLGFNVLVLCAMELQTPDAFPEVGVYMCPMDDSTLSEEEARDAHEVAVALAKMHRGGARILVTCAAGRNRSGLVSALTIRLLLGCSGRQASNLVRLTRPNALTNPSFRAYLESLPAPSAASQAGHGRGHRVPATAGRLPMSIITARSMLQRAVLSIGNNNPLYDLLQYMTGPSFLPFATSGSISIAPGGTIVLTQAQLTGNNPIILAGVLTSDATVEIPNTSESPVLIQNGTSGMFLVSIKTVGGTASLVLAPGQIKDFWSNGVDVQSSDPYSFVFRRNISLVGAIGDHDTGMFRAPANLLITRSTSLTKVAAVGGASSLSMGTAAPFNQVLAITPAGIVGTLIGEALVDFGTAATDTGSVHILTASDISFRNTIAGAPNTAGQAEAQVLGILLGSVQ